MLSLLQKMIDHLLQIHVLQIHVLQIRVLQIHVLQIQSVFYKSNPVLILQYAIWSGSILRFADSTVRTTRN